MSSWPCPGGAGHSHVLTLPGKWAGEGPGIAGWLGARSPQLLEQDLPLFEKGVWGSGSANRGSPFS